MKKNKVSDTGNTSRVEKEIEIVKITDVLSKERRENVSYCPHMMVAGDVGVDTNFAFKTLVRQAICSPDSNVIIVDAIGDYKELCENCEDFKVVSVSSDVVLNPLESKRDGYSDFFRYHNKFNFLENFFKLAMSKELVLSERSCLSIAYNKIKDKCDATLSDLYEALKETDSEASQDMRDALYPYLKIETFNSSKPALNFFSLPKVTYVDLSSYGGAKEEAFMFAIEWASMQMISNLLKEHRRTFVCVPYIDKLKNVPEDFLSSVVKRARKDGGVFFFATNSVESFYRKHKGVFIHIATNLMLKLSDSDFKFMKDCLALPEWVENVDWDSKKCLLVEGLDVAICQI